MRWNFVRILLNLQKENKIIVDLQVAMECTQRKVLNYDKFGDSHYDIISAFQNPLRSDQMHLFTI